MCNHRKWEDGVEVKHKKIKGMGMQINIVKIHSPQEGKNKWLFLFSASMLLQFPGWSGDGGEKRVLFFKGLS